MMEPARRARRVLHALALLWTPILLSATPAAAQSTHDIVDQLDVGVYRYYVDELLYARPGDNRGHGPEHDLARANIFDTLVDHGLDPFLHPFLLNGNTYYNVIAVKPGAVTPDRFYIIGAHYDSVNNPGADDNASGTAGVLEIARVLARYEFESTIVFAAFDREEDGMKGSGAYSYVHRNDDVRGVISLDMIAYDTGARSVDLFGRTTSDPLKQALGQAVAEYGGGLSFRIHGQLDRSDHAPFERRGFQGCLIIEDSGRGALLNEEIPANPYYHTQDDHIEMPGYIDYEYALGVCRSVCGWLVDQAVLVPACPADLDGSGDVGLDDMLILLAAWGPCDECPEDLDGSGAVGIGDLLVLLAAWGPCA